ncbi:hypothetical protein [Aliikangiella sp. IMCC44632]
MSFNYEKDAIKAGKTNLLWGALFLIGLVLLQFFFLSKPEFPIFAVFVIWFIFGLGILLAFNTAISLLKSGGKWEIVIDNDKISWSSPNESIDKSFNILINEIAAIILRFRKQGSKVDYKPDYIIKTKSGVEFKLSATSGVNIQMVFTELERKGIEVINERT